MRKHFALGALFGFLCFACVGASFNYQYYGLAATSYDGTMLGPTVADDLPLSTCAPTATDKAPCMVLKTSVMLQIKSDYEDLENELTTCQKGTSSASTTSVASRR